MIGEIDVQLLERPLRWRPSHDGLLLLSRKFPLTAGTAAGDIFHIPVDPGPVDELSLAGLGLLLPQVAGVEGFQNSPPQSLWYDEPGAANDEPIIHGEAVVDRPPDGAALA